MQTRFAITLVLAAALVGCGDDFWELGGGSDVSSDTASGAPVVEVAPAELEFSEVMVGTSSALEVTVTNAGTAPLSVTRIGIDGPEVFTITRGFGEVVIVPEAHVTVEVTYAPSLSVRSSGSLVIESDDALQPVVHVALGGAGIPQPAPEIAVSPLSVEFGEVLVGSSRSLDVTLHNPGTDTLVVSMLELDDTSSTDLSLAAAPATFSIAPRAETAVTVIFAPSDVGVVSGTLRIQSNDADEGLVTVPIGGTGIPVPEPDIAVAPASLEFSEVLLGSARSLSVAVENSGTAVLELAAIELDELTAPEFSIASGSEKAQIAPGASVEITVTYTPSDLIADTGVLRITSNDADEASLAVSLSGTGLELPHPQVVLEPSALDFGGVLVGSSRTLGVSVTNSGSAPLELTGARFGQGTTDEFELVTEVAQVALDPDGALALDVRYTPRDVGPDSGTLVIESNDPNEPLLTLSLSGSGIPVPAPEIAVSPLSLSFGEVLLGDEATLAAEIFNLGTDTLVISSVDLGAGTSLEFALPGGPSSGTVPPGGSAIVDVTYAPGDLVADGGTLRIQSNDEDEATVLVSLSGTGVPRPVARLAVSPAAVDFGSVAVGDSHSLAVDLTNTGTAVLEIIAVGLDSTTSGEFSSSTGQTASSLPPGETTQVAVTYTPVDAGVDAGELLVQTNDPSRPSVAIGLSGEGVAEVPRALALAWDAPQLNEDGTPVDDLAGFKVYRGSVPGVYTTAVDVGLATEFSLENLPEGTYYFAVTAYDFAGNESVFSGELEVVLGPISL